MFLLNKKNKKIFKCIAAIAAICFCIGSTAGCSDDSQLESITSVESSPASQVENTVPSAEPSDTSATETTTTTPATVKKTITTTAGTKKTSKKVSTTTTAAATKKNNANGVKNPDYKSKYYIVVYTGSQSTVVYGKDSTGAYNVIYKSFTCSTGKRSSPTKTGTYKVKSKYRWRLLVGNVYGQYSSGIGNDYLFHSVPYNKKTVSSLDNAEYDKLGTPASHGCIRLCVRDSKWIYDNVPIGTQVSVVRSSGPAGASIPKRNRDSLYDGWDPSDKWAKDNPYFTEQTTTTSTSATTTTSTTVSTTSTTTANSTETATTSTAA